MAELIKEREGERKLRRFISYLLNLDDNEKLQEVLEHLPDDFENLENESLCMLIKRISKQILECKSCCCMPS